MKSLLLCLPLLLCGCLSDAVATSPRQAEFIDLGPSPRTTAVEPSSRVPAVASPQVVTLYLGDTLVQQCNRRFCTLVKSESGKHADYWQARNNKGDGFTILIKTAFPDGWPEENKVVPLYHWNTSEGPKIFQCAPESFQSSFDQTPKGEK